MLSSSKQQPTRGGGKSALLFVSGGFTAFLLIWVFPSSSDILFVKRGGGGEGLEVGTGSTFYDDPQLSFNIGDSVENWDEKRRDWLKKNPFFGKGVSERMVVVTGSQLKPCKNPVGDSLLLRSFKNKVDYCRLNGYDIFYNNILLQPKMDDCWAKLPAIRAAMMAHPETEWILWADADAIFTDMEFKFPFERYEGYNIVVEGWNTYERQSFTSLNAGVFLIRNCQWSLDFMEVWARQGPQSPEYVKWGKIQQLMFKDKTDPLSDDQSALLYLMLKKRKVWGDKIFLEEALTFQSHWVGVMDMLDNLTKAGVEKDQVGRRHAEKVTHVYDWERRVEERGQVGRPIMIHFAGCQPCSGKHNPAYGAEACWEGMSRALTFADNQVLRNFGLVHLSLSDPASVSPLSHL
ncbi:hypothetical protein QQ045_009476 [Rhodiola kirilowii]